jgi:DNA-binding MarR family transcriptional regulator
MKILQERTGLRHDPHPGEAVILALSVAAGDVGKPIADVLKQHGLNPTSYAVLRMLRGAGVSGLRHSQITERLLLGTPDATRMLVKLERRGWISRARDEADRRVVLHTITEEGRAVLDGLRAPLEGVYDTIASSLGRKGVAAVVEACEHAIATVAQMDERPVAR